MKPIRGKNQRELDLIRQVSEEMKMSMREVQWLGRFFAERDIDPLPVEQMGEKWEFGDATIELTTFDWLHEVPPPNAVIGLWEAMEVWDWDLKATQTALQYPLSIEQLWAILRNSRDWARFWAVRHSSVRVREAFAKDAERFAGDMQRVSDRAAQLLRDGKEIQ